jgi:hypothetical protein
VHAHACASAHVEAAEGEDEVQGSRTESVATGSMQRGRRPRGRSSGASGRRPRAVVLAAAAALLGVKMAQSDTTVNFTMLVRQSQTSIGKKCMDLIE